MADDTDVPAREPVARARTRARPDPSAKRFGRTSGKTSAKGPARPRRRTRAPEQTREQLLRAAVAEFAREGYGGARVDRISKAAKSNDRMLYYYFKSKEKLFHQVIEHCYADLVAGEEALDLDFSRPREALAALVAFNWNYYWEHPELLSILASENLFKGRHVKNNIRRSFANTQLGMLDRLLESGVASGAFRADCDRFHLYLSILSLTYFYRANLYTLSSYTQIDLAEDERRKAWLAHVQAMIENLVRRPK
ncbi:TetR family transcriptional regulator [Bradyrhizobium manausense]|uniref:TetR/AcrR family transcriptional regulator n=1 Tax=Bradyrhizobium manausense TaxID=989370 RepID=UPI001BA73720|nr:TetR/AcrR family transcriptional regulator [Bradyrhizobium manausense]MBR0830378.1 TetR family transcriptional regulator [Bradyrhizobium manausense]